MSLGPRNTLPISVLISALALLVGGLSAPAGAAEPTPTEIELVSARAYADSQVTLGIRLLAEDGEPILDAALEVERRVDDEWTPVGTVTTDAEGRAAQELVVARKPVDNAVRARFAGDETHAPVIAREHLQLKRRASVLRIDAPKRVKDGRSVRVRLRWTARNGTPVAGRVTVLRSVDGGRFTSVRVLRTGGQGRAALSVTPRRDTRWKARAKRQPWVKGDTSPIRRIVNVPPGKPVRLPKAAPSPRRKLPAQGHAKGSGPNVVVSRIPDRIWGHMTGISWRSGCPVGRAGLRLVRVNYWDYLGYKRRGELVANADAAGAMGAALAEMFRRKLPVRAMYRVDRFGWSARSHGGDDYASMAAGNTSAFNCRDVTGRPGVRSPHSYGRSLDLNTWENPYRSAQGVVPNTWWLSRSHPRVAWRSRSHPVVALMARHGLRWTYGTGDNHHFDYVGSRARADVLPRACDRYCD
ncbi:MAG: M15 family metallopeptidase [Nocardioides sp.]